MKYYIQDPLACLYSVACVHLQWSNVQVTLTRLASYSLCCVIIFGLSSLHLYRNEVACCLNRTIVKVVVVCTETLVWVFRAHVCAVHTL